MVLIIKAKVTMMNMIILHDHDHLDADHHNEESHLRLHESIALCLQGCAEQASKGVADLLKIICFFVRKVRVKLSLS